MVFRQALQGLMEVCRCLGTATLSFFCWTLLLVLLPVSLLLPGQLGWWLGVLVVAGVYCLQLRLYAAVSCCYWLWPAAAVTAAGRRLVYSPGAVVAAGLL